MYTSKTNHNETKASFRYLLSHPGKKSILPIRQLLEPAQGSEIIKHKATL